MRTISFALLLTKWTIVHTSMAYIVPPCIGSSRRVNGGSATSNNKPNGGGGMFTRRGVIVMKRAPRPKPVESTGEIPKNLSRKINAKRPTLGHVVPKDVRQAQRTGGSANPRLRAQGKARESGMNNPSNLKILGGSARGKRLDSPDVYLRPMMGKVREAVYSTFTSFGLYDAGEATRHLDVFAGSGSVGLESLSRGAKSCTFVDLSDNCCDAVRRNLKWCDFGDDNDSGGGESSAWSSDEGSKVVCCDAFQAFQNPDAVGIKGPFQIITICPPYEEIVYADMIHAVANSKLVEEDTIIMLEYPIELGCLPHVIQREDGGVLLGVRNRRYGRTVIAMYIVNPTGRLEVAMSRPEEFVSL